MKIFLVFLLFISLSFFFRWDSIADILVLPVTNFNLSDMTSEVPTGWSVDKIKGKPLMRMKKEDNLFYLNLISSGDSSFGVRKEFKVDVKKFPILCWCWKVNKLPQGGDIRKSSTDDQALQLYVAFKAIGFPALTNTPVIGYIWDCEAPKGWNGRSPQIGCDKLRYIVLRNRTDKTGQWYTERRNLYQDYKKLFGDIKGGEPQGLTTGLQIHINTHKTKTSADSEIGGIYFSAAPSDIALAESIKEIKQIQNAKISAVKPPPPPRIFSIKKQPSTDCLNIIIEFNFNSADVDGSYTNEMQKIVEYMIKNPAAKLKITGHTDNTGSDQYNLVLSEKRADSVKNYLVNHFNVDQQRLITRGVGSANPVAGNDTEEGCKNNRCVTIDDCP
ncbi:MAG: hypothetical protein APR62_08140 [Smithella sp. SDB]|nr:MAG: hypothetical protein APR62_08140 [Smithella sp. SDB]